MRIYREWLGRKVMVEIDRVAGCIHPRLEDTVYPIHYGFIPGTRTEAGDAIEIYVVDDPASIDPADEFEAEIIAIVHRKEGGADKLVVSVTGKRMSADEVETAVEFQEKWFKHDIEVLNPAILRT